MQTEVIMAGSGGQGVMLIAGLAYAGMEEGREATLLTFFIIRNAWWHSQLYCGTFRTPHWISCGEFTSKLRYHEPSLIRQIRR